MEGNDEVFADESVETSPEADELEPYDGPLDHAEACAHELEGTAAFVRERPEIVRPGDDAWRVVIRAQNLQGELSEFAAVLEEGAAPFGDEEGDEPFEDDEGPEGTARALAGYLRRMADTVDAHPEVAVLDDWARAVHRLMGVDGGWINTD